MYQGLLKGANAPVTTAGSVSVCPNAAFSVPVTVINFSQITGISLHLEYNPAQMSYTGSTNINPNLSGIIIFDVTVSTTLHQIVVSYITSIPVSLTNGSKLFDLTYTLLSGSPTLSFNNTSSGGGDCEYADAFGNPMIDTPTANFYHDAVITSLGVDAAGSISGLNSVCQGQTGVAYSISAIPNAIGYSWTLPSGGSVFSGNNTNSIVVNYSGIAVSGNISVAGTNSCGTGTSSTKLITVNPSPTPTITGSNMVCLPASGVVYSTESGMSAYQWTISGGTITDGSTTNSITVTWNSAGNNTISVNYSNSGGCSASMATVKNVTVGSRPTPTITGSTSVTVGALGITYTTQSGMTGYSWNLSSGGSITTGSATNTITVLWTTPGSKTVTVNYTNASGCSALVPASLPVMVTLRNAPVTTAGSLTVCPNTTFSIPITVNDFSEITAMSLRLDFNPTVMTYLSYSNLISALSGIFINIVPVSPTLSKVMIVWSDVNQQTLSNGSKIVDLNFTLITGSPTLVFNTTATGGTDCEYADAYANPMNDLPAETYYFNSTITNDGTGAAGSITGTPSLCGGVTGVSYSITPVSNASAYVWSLPTGVSVASGAGTNAITVNVADDAASGDITVYGYNICGNGLVSPAYTVTVTPLPAAPVITVEGTILTSSIVTGNQWYLEGDLIVGATEQTYDATPTGNGNYSDIATVNGCSSEPSNIIPITTIGLNDMTTGSFSIYPVPNDGSFTITFSTMKPEIYDLQVYNSLGMIIYEINDFLVNGVVQKRIDIKPVSSGVYTVVTSNKNHSAQMKLIINK